MDFSQGFLKYLFGVEPSFEDFFEIDEEFAKTLKWCLMGKQKATRQAESHPMPHVFALAKNVGAPGAAGLPQHRTYSGTRWPGRAAPCPSGTAGHAAGAIPPCIGRVAQRQDHQHRISANRVPD